MVGKTQIPLFLIAFLLALQLVLAQNNFASFFQRNRRTLRPRSGARNNTTVRDPLAQSGSGANNGTASAGQDQAGKVAGSTNQTQASGAPGAQETKTADASPSPTASETQASQDPAANGTQASQDPAANGTQASQDPAANGTQASKSDFCTGKGAPTNGQQIRGGSCSSTMMGELPSVGKMVSTIILSPENGATVDVGKSIPLVIRVSNLQAGFFDDPQAQYYAQSQELNADGVIKGHHHVTVQKLDGNQAPNPQTFVFFQGLNGAADANGQLQTVIPNGLAAGEYRLCTIASSSGHQQVLMPVARRGAQDDCIRFTVGQAPEATPTNTSQEASPTIPQDPIPTDAQTGTPTVPQDPIPTDAQTGTPTVPQDPIPTDAQTGTPTSTQAGAPTVLCLCCAAVAHIVANPPEAERNSSVEVSFRVGHGCSTTDPTINFTLTMPEAISSVSVGAVSNWTVSYSFRNATDPSKKQPEWVPSGQEVDTVTWEGYLPPTQFQEFPLRFMTPATGDVLYFPAIQQCANETRNWTDISQSGAAQEPKSPAAALNLTDKKGSSSSAANSVLQFGPLIVAALLSLIALV